MKLIVVVRYDFDEAEDQPVLSRVEDLHRRLGGLPPATVWVGIDGSYDRVSAAVDAEADPPELHPTRRDPLPEAAPEADR